MKYLTILVSFSLLSATVTNTATLSLNDDVVVTINGNLNNSGDIFVNDYSSLEINGCYSEEGGNIFGSYVINDVVGDINCDAEVNIQDIIVMINMILPNETSPTVSADVNQDGVVNILDILIVLNIALNN